MNGVFEGIHGAISLSLIAFSIVFLVLAGLTGVIYAVRFISSAVSQKEKSQPSVGKSESSSTSAPSTTSNTSGTAEEIVAAITGALVARLGRGFKIVSIKPRDDESHDSPWKGWGRMEAMQGMDRSVWNRESWN